MTLRLLARRGTTGVEFAEAEARELAIGELTLETGCGQLTFGRLGHGIDE